MCKLFNIVFYRGIEDIVTTLNLYIYPKSIEMFVLNFLVPDMELKYRKIIDSNKISNVIHHNFAFSVLVVFVVFTETHTTLYSIDRVDCKL